MTLLIINNDTKTFVLMSKEKIDFLYAGKTNVMFTLGSLDYYLMDENDLTQVSSSGQAFGFCVADDLPEEQVKAQFGDSCNPTQDLADCGAGENLLAQSVVSITVSAAATAAAGSCGCGVFAVALLFYRRKKKEKEPLDVTISDQHRSQAPFRNNESYRREDLMNPLFESA
eukprot:TRINITY_DN316_c0_g1_i2.p1 TRINITY_DN316_c0_g1~~TRINITY_DN316_c0_g1_i2.p1  ORF type:complete len:171 (+),score=42.90 TRINITY_DN316_c0_g1_i2:818-1330(+)